MMEYTSKYWNMLKPLLRKSLKKRIAKQDIEKLFSDANKIYRDMLNKATDIGKENPMASNLYECLIFLALYEAANGKITINDLREISQEVMSTPVFKVVGLLVNANNQKGVKNIEKMMKKSATWLDEHPEYKEYSWDFNFDESKHKEGVYYHFTKCPLNEFARKNGYLDVLPVMCDIDYLTAKIFHARLYREQTLALGGSKCDYWMVGDKIKNPT